MIHMCVQRYQIATDGLDRRWIFFGSSMTSISETFRDHRLMNVLFVHRECSKSQLFVI